MKEEITVSNGKGNPNYEHQDTENIGYRGVKSQFHDISLKIHEFLMMRYIHCQVYQ